MSEINLDGPGTLMKNYLWLCDPPSFTLEKFAEIEKDHRIGILLISATMFWGETGFRLPTPWGNITVGLNADKQSEVWKALCEYVGLEVPASSRLMIVYHHCESFYAAVEMCKEVYSLQEEPVLMAPLGCNVQDIVDKYCSNWHLMENGAPCEDRS